MNISTKLSSFYFAIFILSLSNAQEDENLEINIVGGIEAVRHEFPWMVNLNTHNTFCGGSIINKDWILTAGHCVQPKYCTMVTVGGHNLRILEIGQETIKSCQIIRHEGYVESKKGGILNDIALIKLSKSIEFSNTVKPIPLPPATLNPSGKVTVAGWGTLKDSSSTVSEVLRKVDVNIVEHRECQYVYGVGSDGPIVTNDMICAAEKGKDACQGDSGGPLMYKSGTSDYNVIGIVSFNNGCANAKYPSVYAKVTPYINWINNVIASSPSNTPCTCLASSIVITPAIMLFLIAFIFD